MKIAVIGDYTSPNYKDLLQRVKINKPEEDVLDLSNHHKTSWNLNRQARFEDIISAHLVVISKNYLCSLDARRDITHAQLIGRNCLVEFQDSFLPFTENDRTI